MAITIRDLRREVDILNQKFKKTDKTAVKFAISSAYGGHQIVVRSNKGGGVTELTYGHKTPREVINDLERKPMSQIRYTVDRYHKHVMSFRKK